MRAVEIVPNRAAGVLELLLEEAANRHVARIDGAPVLGVHAPGDADPPDLGIAAGHALLEQGSTVVGEAMLAAARAKAEGEGR